MAAAIEPLTNAINAATFLTRCWPLFMRAPYVPPDAGIVAI
jgi:hypothetical protein